MHHLLCLTGALPPSCGRAAQQAWLALRNAYGMGGSFTRAQAVATIMGACPAASTKRQALNTYKRLWRNYCFTHAVCWLGWHWARSGLAAARYPWAVATPAQRTYWARYGCAY